jgi:CubicO group peptidase (beta-lactamase class C family)
VCTGLVLLAACSVTRRPPANLGLETADSLVAAAIRDGTIPGAVLLVARNGEILLERAYGFSALMEVPPDTAGAVRVSAHYRGPPRVRRGPRRMTTSTAFDLASVTKVMATTMAVMLLLERGQVDLEAPVYHYLPEFRGTHKDSVTVYHLLTHSAGLAQWQPVYYSATTSEEALATICASPLEWGVGEARHYSDLGFMLLGHLVERKTGMRLDRFIAEELYRPLGLQRTGFRPRGCTDCPAGPFAATSHGNPFEYRMVHDTAFGYRYTGDPDSWSGWRRHTLAGEVNDGNAFHAYGGVAGHAGLFSTAREVAALLEVLLHGGESAGRRLLQPATVATFLARTAYGQALGWQTPDWAPDGSFSHTGFTGTFVAGIPSWGLAVVLLTNRQHLGVDENTRYPDLGALQRSVVETVLAGEAIR